MINSCYDGAEIEVLLRVECYICVVAFSALKCVATLCVIADRPAIEVNFAIKDSRTTGTGNPQKIVRKKLQ